MQFSNANCIESGALSLEEDNFLVVSSVETVQQFLILCVSFIQICNSGLHNLKIIFQGVSEIKQIFPL